MKPGGERGTVYSYSVVVRGSHPVLGSPYVVGLVRLDEGPIVVSNLIGADVAERVTCEMPVALRWLDASDGRKVPVYVLACSQNAVER